MKKLAFCGNIPELLDPETWRDKFITDKYPGSRFLNYLYQYAMDEGLELCNPVKLLSEVKANRIEPKDILVVQEEFNEIGLSLIQHGAHASIVFCLESPLYVPRFYSELESIKRTFTAQILFGNLGSHRAYFPSFDPLEMPETKPFSQREKTVCMVMSNKNLHSSDPNSLQTLRYEIIERLKQKEGFDLYGKGWIEGYGKEIPPGDKIKVISEYQTNVCIENYRMEGYVTEKLIECLVARCKPIYMGAPDVSKFVPAECFFDGMKANEFLNGPLGFLFSYQYFAGQIMDILLNQEYA